MESVVNGEVLDKTNSTDSLETKEDSKPSDLKLNAVLDAKASKSQPSTSENGDMCKENNSTSSLVTPEDEKSDKSLNKNSKIIDNSLNDGNCLDENSETVCPKEKSLSTENSQESEIIEDTVSDEMKNTKSVPQAGEGKTSSSDDDMLVKESESSNCSKSSVEENNSSSETKKAKSELQDKNSSVADSSKCDSDVIDLSEDNNSSSETEKAKSELQDKKSSRADSSKCDSDVIDLSEDNSKSGHGSDDDIEIIESTEEAPKHCNNSKIDQTSDGDVMEVAKSPDPLAKLNEHLNSIGDHFNHTPKSDFPTVNNVPPKPGLHLVCDKENRCADLSHVQDKNVKETSNSFVFAELSREETGFPEVFDGLVKIGKYISVKGDFTLRSTEALVESPSLVAPYLLKEPDSFPPREEPKGEVKDFFHTTAGEILVGIGLSRVKEWYHRDMVRIKKRQIKKNGSSPELESDLALHQSFHSECKKANNMYTFPYQVCTLCGFTTDSSIVHEGHLLRPHLTQRKDYQCNFCDVINKDPREILEHMQRDHRKIGRIEPPVFFFECPYCSFENNSKVKLNNHLAKCARFFDIKVNLAPPRDFELPALTPKPITVAVVKAYEKSLGSMQRGRGRPKKDLNDLGHMKQGSPNVSVLSMNQSNFRPNANSPLTDSLGMQNLLHMPNMNLRPAHGIGQIRPVLPMSTGNRFLQINSSGQLVPMLGNNHLVSSPQFPFAANLDASGKNSSLLSSMFSAHNQTLGKDIGLIPLPKLQGPYPIPAGQTAPVVGTATNLQSNNLVVCEICDGYIKDLEQLRTHMQLIHKVKIHPKMLVSRPPLNCQKCQWRFFTDQGLERHLLGAHGLVTSNMQELSNKGKDAGCCTICGRVYASKLVSHINQVHKITLKPAHLSYKCTVCSATFNLYRLFENHVYLVHSGAAKRTAEGRSSPPKKMKPDEEPSNHNSDVADSRKCKCGNDVKVPHDVCEKCLDTDDTSLQGALNTKTCTEELTNKVVEKVAV